MPHAARIAIALLVALALAPLAGCKARTDRALYGAGDGGTTFLENGSDRAIEVDCTLHLDQAVDGAWVPRGVQTLDACEVFLFNLHVASVLTFAPLGSEPLFDPDLSFSPLPLESIPLPPGGRIHSSFQAPEEPGQWRVRYAVGLGCGSSVFSALAHERDPECSFDHIVETPAFGVEEFCAPEECVEEPPSCRPDLPLDILTFADLSAHVELVSTDELDPVQPLVHLNSDPFDGPISLPVPLPRPIPFPFPTPAPECRRDLETTECRWVCDDSFPTPPPHGY